MSESKLNIKNLTILRDFLKRGDLKLPIDMRTYFIAGDGVCLFRASSATPDEYECGTSCCLAGYGPAAGIAAEGGETWDSYVYRVFGCESERGAYEFGAYYYLFSETNTNDLDDAIKRLDKVIEGRVKFDE